MVSLPPIPQKIKPFRHEKERKSRREWERYLQQHIKKYQKAERRMKDEGMLNAYDLCGAMLRRRAEAILNFLPKIYERYHMLTDATPNALGEEWISLTTALCSYSYEEVQSHILFAAALWILDHIDVAAALPFLPKEDALLEETYGPNLWDTQHDYDLILSVQYLLENRNGLPESNGRGCRRVITDSVNAEGARRSDDKNWQNYEALIALLPQEEIKRAAGQLEELFWRWTDQYFFGFKEIAAVSDGYRKEYEALCLQFNDLIDDLTEAFREKEREEMAQKRAAKQAPLLVLSQQSKQTFPLSGSGPMNDLIPPGAQRIAVITKKLWDRQERMESVFEKFYDVVDSYQTLLKKVMR